MTETPSEDLVRIAFFHSGSGSWDSIMDTLQAQSEGGYIPKHIIDQRLLEVALKAREDYKKLNKPSMPPEDFAKKMVDDFQASFSGTSEKSKDLKRDLDGLDLLVVSNLKIGTEENEHAIVELAQKVGIKQVKFYYNNPVVGKAEAIAIPTAAGNMNTVFLSDTPNEASLNLAFSGNPRVLLLADQVMPGYYDPEADGKINTTKFQEFAEKFHVFLRSINTIIAPAYVNAGETRTHHLQLSEDRTVTLVNGGPTLNLSRSILGYDADRLETLTFMSLDSIGKPMLIDVSGQLKPSTAKTHIIDPVKYKSMESWSAFIGAEEKSKKSKTVVKSKEDAEVLSDRARYLAKLNALPIENPNVEGVRDLFPHLSPAHIEDILRGKSLTYSLPPLRSEESVQVVQFVPKEGDEPARLEWLAEGDGPYTYTHEAQDFARLNWKDKLEPFKGDIVKIVFDDPRKNLGKPNYPSKSEIVFATKKPWKDIVGEARIPWSKVTDNDIEPESFDECIFSEISRGKTPIEIKVELSHYSELPPRIRQELGIIEKPVEPAEVPVKPIAADVGDARTIHRPREHGGTRAYPTVGEDPFAGKKKPLEVFKDPDFIEKVERYFKICQFVHAKEAPEELIKRLEEPLFAGMVSLVLRYRAGNRDIQKRIQEIAQKYPEAFAELISEFRDPLTKKIEELEEMLENANAVRAAHLEEIGNLQTDVKNFKAGKAYAITEGQRNVDAEKKVNEDLRIDLARIAKERARAKRGNKAAVVLFLIAAASAGGIYYLNDQNKKLGESNGDQAVQINRLSGQNTQANEKIDMLEQKIVEMKEAFGGGDGDVGEAVKYLVDYISEVRVALTGTPSGSITVPALTYEGKLELVKKVYNIIVDFNGRVAELSRNHANVRSELEQYRTETQAKLEGLSVQLTDAKKTLADTEASLRTANNLTEEQKKQIEQYTAAAEELQGKLEELQEEVKKIPGLEDRVQKLTDDNSKLQTARDEALQRQNSAEEAAKKASERAIEATDRLQEAIKAIDQAGKEYDAAVAKNNDLMQKLAEAETVSQAYSTVQQQYQILLRHVNARIIRLPESIGDRVTPETDRQFFRGSLGEMYGQFEGVRFYVMPGDDGTDRPFAEVRRLVDGKIQVSFESIAEAGLVQLDQGFKRAAEAQYEANRKQVFNAFSFMMYEHFVRNGNEEYKATFAELAQQIGAMIKNPNIDVKAMLKKSMENTFGSMEDDSIYHIGNPFKKTEEKK